MAKKKADANQEPMLTVLDLLDGMAADNPQIKDYRQLAILLMYPQYIDRENEMPEELRIALGQFIRTCYSLAIDKHADKIKAYIRGRDDITMDDIRAAFANFDIDNAYLRVQAEMIIDEACLADRVEIKPKKLTRYALPTALANRTLFKDPSRIRSAERVKNESGEDQELVYDIPIKAESKSSKKQASVWIRCDLTELYAIYNLDRLTPYDRQVLEGILTCWINEFAILPTDEHFILTDNDIYKGMTGKTMRSKSGSDATGGKKTQAQGDRIRESLLHMNSVWAEIDNHEEQELFIGNDNIKVFRKRGRFVDFHEIIGTYRGHDVRAYEFLGLPILLQYYLESRTKDHAQITTFDIKIADLPISMTDTNLEIKEHLLSMIAAMKSNKDFSRYLTYKKFYEECGAETKLEKQRVRAAIKKCLVGQDSLQEKGVIKGYSERFRGKTAEGIDIEL